MILIPVFIAEGWHTRETIPEDLGLTGEVTVRDGKTIFYGAPVGTHPSMANLIVGPRPGDDDGAAGCLKRVSAGAPRTSPRLPATPSRRGWMTRPKVAPSGRCMVRPAPTGWLLAAPHGRRAGGGLGISEDPRAAREIARLTEGGEYRPLKSSPNLRRGWELRVADARALATAMNYLYPAGVVHWYLHREGRLGLTSFRENAARQSGIYKRVQRLSDQGVLERGQRLLRGCGVSQEDPLGRGRGRRRSASTGARVRSPAPSRAASSSPSRGA